MATIESLFGVYTRQLQVMIDEAADQFDPVFFPQFFTWGTPTLDLDWSTLVGEAHQNAIASVISRGSKAPLRSRKPLAKKTGTIPLVAEKFKMDEADYRRYLALQGMTTVPSSVRLRQLLDYMFDDVRACVNGCLRRIDHFVLQGMSTGAITINTVNNPDGVVQTEDIDLGMPEDHQDNAAVSWATPATSKPISDILRVVNFHRGRGTVFSNILMTWATWTLMQSSDETKAAVTGGAGSTIILPTLDSVNAYLTGNRMPTVRIIDEILGVEKNGIVTEFIPWKNENVVFISGGTQGEIATALDIEQIRPVENVQYATYQNVLISKYAQNDPFLEYTEGRLSAFPTFPRIDRMHILSSTAQF